MGSVNLKVDVRGDVEVLLTKFINDCEEDKIGRVLEQLDKDGVIN